MTLMKAEDKSDLGSSPFLLELCQLLLHILSLFKSAPPRIMFILPTLKQWINFLIDFNRSNRIGCSLLLLKLVSLNLHSFVHHLLQSSKVTKSEIIPYLTPYSIHESIHHHRLGSAEENHNSGVLVGSFKTLFFTKASTYVYCFS